MKKINDYFDDLQEDESEDYGKNQKIESEFNSPPMAKKVDENRIGSDEKHESTDK